MADSLPDPYEAIPLTPELVKQLVHALGFAFLTVQPLFLHPHDPIPQALMTQFGLTFEALTAYSNHKNDCSLRNALIDEVPTYTYYALAAQEVVQTPVLAASLRAMREQQVPGADDWDEYAAMIIACLELLVHVSATVAADYDDELAAATLLVQRGQIAGLFARLGHTLRPFGELLPPAPASTTVWALTPNDRAAAQMAVRMPNALVLLTNTPFTNTLRLMPRLQPMPAILLQLRLDALPDPEDPAVTDLDLSSDDLLLLWQGAEVARMAMYASVTPLGTWEDWLRQNPQRLAADDSNRSPKTPAEWDDEYAEICAALQAFELRLRTHLAATHPNWLAAEAEVAALRAAL